MINLSARLAVGLFLVVAFCSPLSAAATDSAAKLPLSGLISRIESGDFGSITSILVEQRGQIVHESYFTGDEATLRDTRSATKTVTSMLIGAAIAEGALSGVDALVMEVLGKPAHDNPDPRKDAMTVEDLLTMTSVMECNDWNSFSRGNEERMYLVEDWTRFFIDLPIRGIPPWEPAAAERPYGRAHSYCTAGVFVLGRVVAMATEQSVESYSQKVLFGPLGIEELQWQYSPLQHAQTGGGLRLSSRSLAALGRLQLNGGETADGTRILPESWAEASITPKARIDDDDDYGYLWWLKRPTESAPDFVGPYMTGSGGNRVHLLPAYDAVVVITTENFRVREAHSLTDQIMVDYVVPALRAE